MAQHALITQHNNVVKYNYRKGNTDKILENHLSDIPWMTEVEKEKKKNQMSAALWIPAPVAPVNLFSNAPVNKDFIRNIKGIYQIVDERCPKAIWDIGCLDADFGQDSEVKLLSLIANELLLPTSALWEANYEIMTFKKSYMEDDKIEHLINIKNSEWNDFVIMVIFNEVIVMLSSSKKVSLENFMDGLNVVPAQMTKVEDILDYNDDE